MRAFIDIPSSESSLATGLKRMLRAQGRVAQILFDKHQANLAEDERLCRHRKLDDLRRKGDRDPEANLEKAMR